MPDVKTEIRSSVLPVEHRADDDGAVTIAGYAAIFDEPTEIGDYFIEEVAPGAFSETLKGGDVLAYFGHDRNRVLGRQSSKTLRLTEDSKGLAVEIDLPDTTDGRDAMKLIDRGDIQGMSFGFRVTKEEWDETGDTPKRTIQQVDLFEVSIVSEPAYDGTSIALRSLDEARKEVKRKNFNAAALRREMKLGIDTRAMSARQG